MDVLWMRYFAHRILYLLHIFFPILSLRNRSFLFSNHLKDRSLRYKIVTLVYQIAPYLNCCVILISMFFFLSLWTISDITVFQFLLTT